MSSEQVTPGTVFGRDFRVLERLAAGGMGTVYIAEQLSTGKRRALKVMHAQYEGDERARRRFIDEARVGASIDSDHIVEMVGAGIDDDTNTPWIAMELLNGQDLKQRVAERGPLSIDDVVEICRQLCHALGEAHRRGLVHRDLKPENIFLANPRREGVQFTVKLLDFGIAKLVQENHTQASHTQAVGSPRWMAPEQAERGARIVPATDVWALGLIVFNLLTGRCYWRTANSAAPSVMQQMCEVIMDPIEPASLRAQEYGQGHAIPQGFDDWFARCVTRDLFARFQNADEALSGLTAAIGGAGLSQRRSTRPPSSNRPRADFRLDTPLPKDEPFSLAAPVSIAPPDPSRSLAPPDPSRSLTPMEHSRSLTPPSAATEFEPSGQLPEVPRRRRSYGLVLIAAASVATLATVSAIALRQRDAQPPRVSQASAPAVAALPDVPAVAAAADVAVSASDVPDASPLHEDLADAAAEVAADVAPSAPPAEVQPPVPQRVARAAEPRGAREQRPQSAAAVDPAEATRATLAYQATAQAVLRGRHVAFIACYERGTEGNAAVSGNLLIEFQVGPSGSPVGVSTRGLAAAPEVGRCVADVVRELTFPAPPVGTIAIAHSIRFSRRFDAPAAPPAEAPQPAESPRPAPAESPRPAPAESPRPAPAESPRPAPAEAPRPAPAEAATPAAEAP